MRDRTWEHNVIISEIQCPEVTSGLVWGEVESLARNYINSQIVGVKSLADCRHIATATVNEVEILTSWNFKHIVNLNKIHLYNGVNLQSGYRTVEIRTPREIVNYED